MAANLRYLAAQTIQNHLIPTVRGETSRVVEPSEEFCKTPLAMRGGTD